MASKELRMHIATNNRIAYNHREVIKEFDDLLDYENNIKIVYFEYSPSLALKRVDLTAYNQALSNYVDDNYDTINDLFYKKEYN